MTRTVLLGDVADIISGQSPEGSFYNQIGEGLPLYQGKKDFGSMFTTSSGIYTTQITKVADPGDILISVRAPVGPVNFASEKMNIGRGLAAIKPNKELNPKFLFLYLQYSESEIAKLGGGTTFRSINRSHLKSLRIPLPEVLEQKRIVKKLDDVFAAIDKAKENTEKNLANSRELFESYLQSVFVNPGDGWDEKTLKEIGVTKTGLTPKTTNKEYYGDFIPFITPADVDIHGNGSVRYDSKGLSKDGLRVGRKIEKNSVLMVCIGATIGKVGFVTREVSCNQQINTLTPQDQYEAKLFYYILSTKSFLKKIMKGSSQATLPIINKGKWENLSVVFPKSFEGQKSIVAKLDILSAETKRLESIYKQKIAELEELRQSYLKQAFGGKL